MKTKLLSYLVCPNCGGNLKLEVLKKDLSEVIEGLLKCACKEVFPIIQGVPRLLLEPLRSRVIEEQHPEFFRQHLNLRATHSLDALSKKKLNTSVRFGYEWQRFSKLEKEYEEQFLDWIYPIKNPFFKNKVVLDAGCGMARHLFCAAKFGAKEAIGVDLGPSVDVAYQNIKHLHNAHVVQADIYHLPFKDSFDYAYSIGVLHHLPAPEEGFKSVLSKVKKKGSISIWVYGQEGNGLLQIVDPIRRFLFSKLPLGLNQALSFVFTLPIYPLIQYVYRPLNNQKRSICAVLPQNDFMYYLSKFPFHVVHSIIFDQMLAPIAFYLKKSEVNAWFTREKLKKVNISWRNKNSWRGYGEK
ncbi:MAG: methyltransferase domain-containing protein [Nanoarchaeota archaeon]